MTITSPPVEIARDRWGRPMVVPEDGGKAVAYTRCTTYVGCLEDTYNISLWQQRMVALGLSLRNDLRLAVAAHKDDKTELNAVCEQAKEAAQAHGKATIGTALHSMTEQMDKGEELVGVPIEYAADLAAYQVVTEALKPTHIEQFCVQDVLQIGGTPDRVVRYQGSTYIADLKTGNVELGIGKIAMQLAVYARSKTYDIATAERGVHGADTQKAIIIHLPAGEGTCRLIWVDIAAGWEAVTLAGRVRNWRKRKFNDLASIIGSDFQAPPPPPSVDMATLDLAQRVKRAKSVEALGALWQENVQAWTPALTETAALRKKELLAVAQ